MHALKVLNVNKTYRDGFKALQNISLNVKCGDFFGLLGPNGAGKTTLISIITSLTRKDSGSIAVNEIDINHDFNRAKSLMGLVPQEFNFNIFLSVWDTVINQAGYYGIPYSIATQRAKKYLSELSLWDRRKQMVRFLSGGLKRRLMIARALMHEPAILFLDEPTAGVDVELRRWLWNFLKKQNSQGLTIILTTHYLEEAENLCKEVAIIDQGKIIKRTEIKQLLRELHTETFIFDLKYPLTAPYCFEHFDVTVLDNMTLEINMTMEQNLNQIFKMLNKNNLIINSMRNKTNRLEELFLKLTQDHKS